MNKILFLMVSVAGGSFIKSHSMEMFSYVYSLQKTVNEERQKLQTEVDKCLLAFQAATEEKESKHQAWVEAKDKLWQAQLQEATELYKEANKELLPTPQQNKK